MSDPAKELEAMLSAWCQSYVDAFSDYDAEGIERHWVFPALIINDGKRIAFKSAEQFTRNTSALLGFYKRQGVARAERKLITCMQMHIDVAAMRVHDQMLDASGNNIVEWQAAYVLQNTEGAWRAACAVADGEADAWKARGTPLGS